MRIWLVILLVFALAAGTGCGGDKQFAPFTTSVIGVYGSTATGVSAELTGNRLALSFTAVPHEGQFISVGIPANSTIASESWQADKGVLHLAAPVKNTIEVGLVPLKEYTGGPVTALLELGSRPHAVSTPPLGPQNAVNLNIVEVSEDTVRLEWTEANRGDYNSDGKVNVGDLTPLAMFFGWTSSISGWDVAKIADGNGDGQVGITDLVPIAVNYLSEIAGYNVKHGPAGSTPVTVEQVDRNSLDPHIPRQYSIELPGKADDEWAVAPFDLDGIEGTGSNHIVVDRLDLRASLSYFGSDLWDFDGLESGPLGPNNFVMRIIDPIDFPGRMPINPYPKEFLGQQPGVNLFDELPLHHCMMLDFHYAPTVDPTTGNSVPVYSEQSQWITSVPFMLDSPYLQYGINVQITLVPKGDDIPGYWIDSLISQGLPDQIELSRYTRLDPQHFLVQCDTTGDGKFENESLFFDLDLDGVSGALLQRQEDYNSFDVYGAGQIEDVEITATVFNRDSFLEGYIKLNPAAKIIQTPNGPLEQPILVNGKAVPVQLNFTEHTLFNDLIYPGGYAGAPFISSDLVAGDKVLVEGVSLWNSTRDTETFWADSIKRIVNQ
jgi:hypothetical protein